MYVSVKLSSTLMYAYVRYFTSHIREVFRWTRVWCTQTIKKNRVRIYVHRVWEKFQKCRSVRKSTRSTVEGAMGQECTRCSHFLYFQHSRCFVCMWKRGWKYIKLFSLSRSLISTHTLNQHFAIALLNGFPVVPRSTRNNRNFRIFLMFKTVYGHVYEKSI